MSSSTPYSVPAQPEQKPKKKGGCLKWGAIIVGIIVVLAIISGLSGGDKEESNNGTETDQNSAQQESPADNQNQEASDDGSLKEDPQDQNDQAEQDVPREFKNALKKAKMYSDTMHTVSYTHLTLPTNREV